VGFRVGFGVGLVVVTALPMLGDGSEVTVGKAVGLSEGEGVLRG